MQKRARHFEDMNIYFSILGLMLLSIGAVVVLPIVLVVSFLGFTGLAALYARCTLNGARRKQRTAALHSQVSGDTSALATHIRSTYFGVRGSSSADIV
jgi:hypothetical protein